jgi:hypothetical protein
MGCSAQEWHRTIAIPSSQGSVPLPHPGNDPAGGSSTIHGPTLVGRQEGAMTSTRSMPDQLDGILGLVRARREAIIAEVADETAMEPERVANGLELALDTLSRPALDAEQVKAFRSRAGRLAREGAAAERVLAAYLSINWYVWQAIAASRDVAADAVVELADRQMRGLHAAMDAMAEAYADVEVELAAAHAEQRRSVLEELLSAPRTTPADRSRIRRHAEGFGLSPDAAYRLTLIQPIGQSDAAISAAEDRLERAIRAPVRHHRRRPGIELPVALEWRGRILVLGRGDWVGVDRLRASLTRLLRDDWVAVDIARVDGFESVSSALGQAEFAVGIAAGLGYRGWVGDPATIALETTFLLDQPLVRSAIEHELGALLADARMGEELIETLSVYLGCGQNSREAARQLHLSPRTVTYRLERIQTLLGRELSSEAGLRLSAAILALKAVRRADREEAWISADPP